MKRLLAIAALITLALTPGCSTTGTSGPEEKNVTNILESSRNARVYRVDYDTTFRAAVDALRLIDESSAKLVKYDAGIIMFKKPNNAGALTARVKKVDAEKTHVVMSATNNRRFWFDSNDREKTKVFFTELDKLLGTISSGETREDKRNEKQTVSSTEAKSPAEATRRDNLLRAVKRKLQLDEKDAFLNKLTTDELSLLDKGLQTVENTSAQEKSKAGQCAACYIDLARFHHDNGHYPRSAEALKTAIAIEPENALAHCNLGEIYKHLGRVEEALQELNVAKTLNPDLADTYINLGIMYDDYLNDDSKALECYRKYLKLGGADKQVLDWISAIEEGR